MYPSRSIEARMPRRARRPSPRSGARGGRAVDWCLRRFAMTLNTRNIAPLIATEIGADKETLLSGVHASQIRELLEQRGVLVFPRIGFTDDEQIAFTQTLGTFAPELRGEKIYKITL